MAFPQTPIDLLAEMQIGGTWTDVTADLYARSPLTIERGRPDEAARVDPSQATFQLNNRQNKYSPRNPRSANYGLIGRNTPVRFSVPGSESYLATTGTAGDSITTPDHSSLDITSDIDIRIEATADWYRSGHQTLLGKWSLIDGNRSYLLRLANGSAVLAWSTTGLSAAALSGAIALPVLPRRAAIRMTLDVNDGAGGHVVSLYTAASLAGPWTLAGSVTNSTTTTSIFPGTATLDIAPVQVVSTGTRYPWRGRLHRAEVRSGIGGSVVASPDIRALSSGATSWADSAGRTWTVGGAARITNREYRLHAEVSSWASRWDVSGQDLYVPAEASGVMRRLGQGAKPLASTLRRRIPTFGPVAYWPCEEGADADRAYSPVPGCDPLVVSGWAFASDASCPGSSPLPKLNNAASMLGEVPAYTSPTNAWLVALLYSQDAPPASDAEWLSFATTGTARRITLGLTATDTIILGYDAAGSLVINVTFTNDGQFGEGIWYRFDFGATSNGGDTDFHVGWVDVDGEGSQFNWTLAGGTPGLVTRIDTRFGADLAGMRLGHIGVYPHSDVSVWGASDNGYRGETAAGRIVRLCGEEGVALTGASIGETNLGPQTPQTLLALLGEAADADGGVLFEDRESLALSYRGRATFYNQPVQLTLNYASEGEVSPPLEPTDDDQRVRNDRTVTRRDGSSARAVDETSPMSVQAPPAGIGLYDDEIALNLSTDNQVADIAGWRLHLGTWDEARYPSVHIDLAAAPALIPAVLGLDIGDRVQITNPPTWLPPGPIDLIVEGYTETISHPNGWDIVLNCAPAGPWAVAVADDLTLGRAADSGVSTLASGVSSSATSLSIATASGPLWNTTDEPYDIEIDGEVMTVTTLTGSSSPQSATVTRAVNGVSKAHSSGATVSLAQPAITSY